MREGFRTRWERDKPEEIVLGCEFGPVMNLGCQACYKASRLWIQQCLECYKDVGGVSLLVSQLEIHTLPMDKGLFLEVAPYDAKAVTFQLAKCQSDIIMAGQQST